jgi:L,D-peptidoglycan transpeptidase YkuD (ErfK/YbiS/YcfS/YnhG family)
VLLLTAALLGLTLAGDVTAATAAGTTVTLDGVPVQLRAGTRQVVTVNRTSGSSARVTFWARRGDHWDARFQAAGGRIGYGGLVRAGDRVQGSGTTPLGTFRLPWAFGTHARRAAWSDVGYRRIREGDYWVLDNRSRYYNRYRNRSQGGFRWWLGSSDPNASERLGEYRTQYEWAIVVGFNEGQVRHRGSGIFLHVNGRGATAGCVSAPRRFIQVLMARLDPRYRPLIAIGR